MSCLVVMAGGTGGHVLPALAVAEVLRQRGVRIVWMGTRDSLEARVATQAGFVLETLSIKRLRGGGWRRKSLFPWYLGVALLQAWRVLRRYRPDALLGMGGFVSAPGGLAAWLLGKPLVLHEQNAVAGLSNRWLAKLTARVLSGFPEARGLGPSRWVGNPVRAEIVGIAAPLQRLAARRGDLRVLVLGGSQGAEVFNRYLPDLLGRRRELRLEVWHQCGQQARQAVDDRYQAVGIRCRVDEFIEAMAEAYTWADVVICRAGAMTLAEVCAAGVAALLVPYPYAVDDHQTLNAAYLQQQQAALLVNQAAFRRGEWVDELLALQREPQRLLRLASAARALAKPQATAAVAAACWEAMHA